MLSRDKTMWQRGTLFIKISFNVYILTCRQGGKIQTAQGMLTFLILLHTYEGYVKWSRWWGAGWLIIKAANHSFKRYQKNNVLQQLVSLTLCTMYKM